MGDSLKAIHDDTEEYLDRCRRFKVKPQGDEHGADPYSAHAKALEKREEAELLPGLQMARCMHAVETNSACQFGDYQMRLCMVRKMENGKWSVEARRITARLDELESWIQGNPAPLTLEPDPSLISRLTHWWLCFSELKKQVAEDDPDVDSVPKALIKAKAKERALKMHQDWIKRMERLGLVHRQGSENWFTDPLTGKEGNNVHDLFVLRLAAFKKAGVRPTL